MTNNQAYNNQIVINNQKPINQTGLGIGNWLLKFIWSLGFGYWLLFFMTLCLFASPAAQAAEEPVNYKSGISVLFGGTRGIDWDEEVFWHNPVQDDHKVVYIKSVTPIVMQHNERNMHQNFEGAWTYDGVGDKGVIRYKVDNDLSYDACWSKKATVAIGSAGDLRYPAYSGPFIFASLQYHNGGGVLGSFGPGKGVLDKYADEWHTLSFADDDEWLIAGYAKFNPNSHGQAETLASDGKTMLFVVNPKTPLIRFNKDASHAQYYTTPAKSFGIDYVYDQTTYLTDNVSIVLSNIMGGEISYRINGGQAVTYSGPLSSGNLKDGINTIEFWYQGGSVKKRTIIKDPDYSSSGEMHGYSLWKDEAELSIVKGRLQRGVDHGYKAWYGYIKADNFHNHHNVIFGTGRRIDSSASLGNAFVALVEGYNYVKQGETMSYALFAKNFLLDNVCNLDPLWFGDASGQPNPCRELTDRGYYDVAAFFSNAFAYDILIKDYKSTQYTSGITPIEDFKIRDSLARFCYQVQMEMGNYGDYMRTYNVQGMWGMARALGGAIIAVVMPSYNTRYYGTSGFDGTKAVYPYTPYPDYPVSWKDAFFAETNQLYVYPNQAHRYDEQALWLSGLTTDALITEQAYTRADGLQVSPGNFADRIGYFSLMGPCLYITANVMKMKYGYTYELWEKAFDNANKGQLYGLKATADPLNSDNLAYKFPQLLLINKRFPELAILADQNLHKDYDNPETNFTIWKQMSTNYVYSIAFYQDDWASAIVYGDLSGEGDVTAYDAALAARIAVGLDTADANKTKIADVSGDGSVTAYDAALIAQKAVGLIVKFPVES
jgi:hypothetical protein